VVVVEEVVAAAVVEEAAVVGAADAEGAVDDNDIFRYQARHRLAA
jgi:hypothetical protein